MSALPADPPRFTIAVPFVKGAELLRRTIDSVLDQSWQAWELVVVDNFGPEPEVADWICSLDDDRVSYWRADTHVSMGANWNRCLEIGSGELVCLLHSDDELMPGYLEKVVALADGHPVAAAYFTAAITIDDSSEPIFSLNDRVKTLIAGSGEPLVLVGSPGLSRMVIGNFIFASSLCFRRSAIRDLRFRPDLGFVTDMELTTRMLFEGATLVGSNSPQFRYRRHDAQATTELNASNRRLAEERALYAEIASEARRRGWTQAALLAKLRPTVRLNAGLMAIRAISSGRWGPAARNVGEVLLP